MAGRGDGAQHNSSFRTIAGLTAIPLAGLAIFFLWNWWNGGTTPKQAYEEMRTIARPAVARTADAPAPLPAAPPKATEPSATRPRSRGGDIVLIIDDLGFDGQPIERLMALDPNVNCSILPNGNRAEDFAKTLHARGFEILCHLPMEPLGGASPGAGAILTDMPDDEIARLTRENIEAIPFAQGVNNHMGSRATADRRVMTSVLGALPAGLYFIDSRTNGKSIAGAMAKEMNIRTATRHVFLDDVASETFVRKQVAELAQTAEERGLAVGIGHPYPVTMRVLAEEMPRLRERGFRFVRASSVVR